MTTRYAIVPFTTLTSTGTQDITSSDISGWDTGGVAIFFLSGRSGGAGTATTARLSRGAANSRGHAMVLSNRARNGGVSSLQSLHNKGTSQTSSAGRCISMIDPTGNTIEAAARFNAALTNGVRIEWVTAPAAAYEGFALLISGVVDSWIVDSGGTTTTTGPVGSEFRPSFIFVNPTTGNNLGGVTNDGVPGFGLVVDKSPIKQAVLGAEWNRLSDPSDCDGILRNGSCALEVTGNTGIDLDGLSVATITSTGFTSASGIGPCMAVKLDTDATFQIAVETLPSGTGNASFTGLGLKPRVVFGVASLITSEDTIVDGATVATEGVFLFDGTQQLAASERVDEGVSTPASSSLFASAKAIHVLNDAGTDAVVGTVVSLDATGFTLNFTTATAGRMLVFALGAAAEARTHIETEDITDEAILRGATSLVVQETVDILDATASLTNTIVTNALPQGTTLTAGAVRGTTLAGGAVAGAVL